MTAGGLNRRELLKGAGTAIGGGALLLSGTTAAAAGESESQPASDLARTLDLSLPREAPRRLCPATHQLAARGLAGEWGRSMVDATIRLEDRVDLRGMSEEMRYANAVRLIAENAPLRIVAGERVIGSATFKQAAFHVVPIYAKGSVSHVTIGFHDVLKIGYKGLRQRIAERRARGGLDEKGLDLLKAMDVCLDAAALWHRRNIEQLNQQIASSAGEEQANYRRVLANLRNVPENPPATFGEAVQSLWFMYAFQRLCGNWSGIGRIDEMLGPYLKRDLAAGRIALDEARELIAHFWIKGTEWIGANTVPGSGDAQFYQNIILAGIDVDRNEVTNDVTYLVLDVVEELHISDYPIAVRLNRSSPERLLRRMAEVQRYGGGTVAMYNEEVVIESLVRFGYPLEEVRGYTNDGCWEALIPGKTAFIYRPFDALHCLQKAMGTADAKAAIPEYADFQSLYAGFEKELAAELAAHRAGTRDYCRNAHPATLISLFVEGCIEKGRGYYDRGPKYTVLAPHAGGLANVANSLLAIKTLVYDKKLLTFKDYVEALRADWQGQEPLRRIVLSRVPTYGNDDDTADAMTRRVYDTYTAMVAEHREENGVLMPAGISTFGREIEWRAHRRATADGHRTGELLATNFSPSPGTDAKGPTAALKSYCKMDFTRLPNIGTLELKLLPASVQGEAGVVAMVGLMRSFVKLRGCFLHIDVMDSALLLDAQRHPEKYPNLSVRIAGWSARFATMSKDWQDMVIGRTQQVV
jgi:pyruvate-formate lyase